MAPDSNRPRSIGRGIATVVLWAAILYVAGAGLASVVPQVFWPSASGHARKAVPESCTAGIRELKSELLAQASARMAAGGRTDEGRSLERWLGSWDDRYIALEPRCHGRSQETYEMLGQLRHHLENTLQRFDREQAPLVRHIERSLADVSAYDPSENPR